MTGSWLSQLWQWLGQTFVPSAQAQGLPELPKLPEPTIPTIPPLPDLPSQLPVPKVSSLLPQLIGDMLLGTIVFWLLIVGAVSITVEALIVCYRMYRGETFISAVALWGKHRRKRLGLIAPKSVDVETPTLAVVEPSPKHAPEAQPAPVEPPPIALEEPASAKAIEVVEVIEPTRLSTPHPITPDPIPDGEDILSDMYAMKTGMLKVLREQRAMEDAIGNAHGLQALDVFIASVEAADPQKIWDLGSRKIKDSQS